MNHFFGNFDLSQDSKLLLQSLPRPRILVVGDGEEHASLTEDVVCAINADLTIIEDPLEALECCLKISFSVILYAAEMRSEEGAAAAKKTVENSLTRDIPIIFLNFISESNQLKFSRFKSAPVDYILPPAAAHIIVSKVNVFLSLQFQRSAILRMGKNLDLNHTEMAKVQTDAAQNEVTAQDVANQIAGGITSDMTYSSERMDGLVRLSATVAHDFNNMLAIILGNLELLDYEDIQDVKIQARLAPMKSAAERACMLTNQLLGFARRSATNPVVTNVNRVLKRMQPLMLAEISSTIRFTVNLDESLWQACIDPDDFEEAVHNLILNACEAMPDGGQLALETANASLDKAYCTLNASVDPGDYIAVSVTDVGHGIPVDSRPFVFDPLFSGKDERGTKGMGLSQVYGFCQRSKGHVRLDSGPSVGTTAHLYLPRVSGLE